MSEKNPATENTAVDTSTQVSAAMNDDADLSLLERDIKVSIIVPVYNACKFLRPALDSILGQTLKDIEIICIDDGSTDTSLDMIKIYQSNDDRIRILTTATNAGAGLARNNGLKRARGEYVAFLDADDFYEPNMIEELYAYAKENDLDIAISKYDIYDTKKAKFIENVENEYSRIYQNVALTSKNEHPDHILESTTGSAWNKLFKKSFLIEKGITFITDLKMFEDLHFTVCALALAERVGKVHKVLAHHRVYKQQSRARAFRAHYHHALAAFEKTMEFLMKSGMYQPLKRGFLNLSCSRCYYIYQLLKSDSREVFWNMLHDYYSERLGWEDTLAEDFESKEVCEWAANVEMYTYEHYMRRLSHGKQLNSDKIDQTLKQNKRLRRTRAFFARIFKKLFTKKKKEL